MSGSGLCCGKSFVKVKDCGNDVARVDYMERALCA